MGQFMGDNHRDAQLVRSRRLVGVKKKGWFPVGGQTPILHRSRLEVWDSSKIYRADYINGELRNMSFAFEVVDEMPMWS